MGKGATLRTGG